MDKVYGATGQAASILHGMALLRVYQAKALKELHEGSSDPGLMQELRTVTDLALRVTKVTAHSFGQTMATLMVQEHQGCQTQFLEGQSPAEFRCNPN